MVAREEPVTGLTFVLKFSRLPADKKAMSTPSNPKDTMSTDETTAVSSRYRVGCAGMFTLNMDYGVNDKDEAIAACEAGPAGCEVYDTKTEQWIGPTCFEEIEDAKARIAARARTDAT